MMNMKRYVKPEMTMVEIRTEERMAYCDAVFYSSHKGTETCNTVNFINDSPATCIHIISEVGVS